MRRLPYIALTIALSACIAYRVTTERDGITKTREGLFLGPIPIIHRIRTGLSRVRDDVSTRQAQLHPVRCGGSNSTADTYHGSTNPKAIANRSVSLIRPRIPEAGSSADRP
jgi:hypothetical protein